MNAVQAKRRGWWLCLLHLTADIVLYLRWLPHTPMVLHIEFGWLDAQANLVALWIALGGGRLVVRLAVGLLAIAAVTALDRYLTDDYFGDPSDGQFWLMYALRVVTGGLVVAPFAVLRLRGWQLTREHAEWRPAANQFSLRDLAVWTVAAAVALAGLRWGVALMPIDSTSFEEAWIIYVWGGPLAAVCVTAAWAALGNGRALLRMSVSCLVAVLAGPVPVYLAGVDFLPAQELVAMSATQGAVVLASLWMLRSAGYRLRRSVP